MSKYFGAHYRNAPGEEYCGHFYEHFTECNERSQYSEEPDFGERIVCFDSEKTTEVTWKIPIWKIFNL